MFNSSKKFDLSPRLKLGVGRKYSKNSILKFSAILFLVLALGLSINAVKLVVQGNKEFSANPIETGEQKVLGAIDSKTESNEETSYIEYKIQKGDTLFNISQKYNINWSTIATLNNLKTPFSLKPGQTLRIPQ